MLHKLLSIILVMLLSVLPAAADTLTIPNSFTDGTTASATQVNANFTAVSSLVNGNITNSNIKSSAAITLSKLDLTTELFVLRTAAERCVSAGTTGDTVPRVGFDSSGRIFFGPGSATATDLLLKRTDANTLAIRNAADDTDKNLTVGALTASGNVAGVNGTFSGPVSGTTGTFSGAAQATALTLTTTPLPYTSGGTGLATAATGTVLVGNGTGYTAVGPGSSGQVLKSNGTTLAMGAVGGSFGGDSSDGAVTKGATTETTKLQLNSSTFSQTVGTTWQPYSGTIVNAASTAAFAGTTTVANSCDGGTGQSTQQLHGVNRGAGPGGGDWGSSQYGGGGGGHAGAGGKGGSTTANDFVGGGATYPMSSIGGSGGGSGGTWTSGTSGNAGKGGGSLAVCAVGAVTISGTINAKGSAASASATNAAGSGGGSGGDVYVGSQTSINNTGTIDVSGGAGANGVSQAGGGGGGGGWVYFHSPSNTNGTRTVTGGAAGSGGTQAATAGSSGTAVSITGTPNLPLLLSMQSDNFGRLKDIALARKVLNRDLELTQREAAQACSHGSVIQFARLVDGNMTESTCLEIGDAVEVFDNAA